MTEKKTIGERVAMIEERLRWVDEAEKTLESAAELLGNARTIFDTSNMRLFFRDFGIYPNDFHDRPAQALLDALRSALERIKVECMATGIVAVKQKYDDPGGWGSVLSATDWLMEMRSKLIEVAIEQGDESLKTLLVRVRS